MGFEKVTGQEPGGQVHEINASIEPADKVNDAIQGILGSAPVAKLGNAVLDKVTEVLARFIPSFPRF